jgi:t-SNARE complex subunit (syntaxin)
MNGIIKDLMCNNSENIEIIEKNTNISEMKIDNGNKDLVITLKNQNSNRIQKIFGFIICIGIF